MKVVLKASIVLGLMGGLASGQSSTVTPTPLAQSFSLSSAGATSDGLLDQAFTCDGAGLSPPLTWSDAPAGTRSFAVTMHHALGEDRPAPPTDRPAPPAGPDGSAAPDKHVYMVIYNLPAGTTGLEAGSILGSWGVNTVNQNMSYTPPCSQGPGRKDYILTVYALSAPPDFSKLSGSVRMDDLLSAVQNTTLAKASLTLGYSRP